MQLTEGSCFFGCCLKQFLVDVYSTADITRLTNQREEFLVLYILIYTTFLAAFLGYAPSIKCAQVSTQNFGKKKVQFMEVAGC